MWTVCQCLCGVRNNLSLTFTRATHTLYVSPPTTRPVDRGMRVTRAPTLTLSLSRTLHAMLRPQRGRTSPYGPPNLTSVRAMSCGTPLCAPSRIIRGTIHAPSSDVSCGYPAFTAVTAASVIRSQPHRLSDVSCGHARRHGHHCRVGDLIATRQVERRELRASLHHGRHRRVGDLRQSFRLSDVSCGHPCATAITAASVICRRSATG